MRKVSALLAALLLAHVLSGVAPAQTTKQPAGEDAQAMTRMEQEYGKLNANAPPELARFAFLIGNFRGEARLKREDGSWDHWKVTWEGRYILDGYAIADEFRMTTSTGELVVMGMNFRAYDAKNKTWNLKWLNALGGSWVELGPAELGGVTADEKAITYSMKEPMAAHRLTRATYTNFSANHFTWRGEKSNDGKTWEEFLVIEMERSKD